MCPKVSLFEGINLMRVQVWIIKLGFASKEKKTAYISLDARNMLCGPYLNLKSLTWTKFYIWFAFRTGDSSSNHKKDAIIYFILSLYGHPSLAVHIKSPDVSTHIFIILEPCFCLHLKLGN